MWCHAVLERHAVYAANPEDRPRVVIDDPALPPPPDREPDVTLSAEFLEALARRAEHKRKYGIDEVEASGYQAARMAVEDVRVALSHPIGSEVQQLANGAFSVAWEGRRLVVKNIRSTGDGFHRRLTGGVGEVVHGSQSKQGYAVDIECHRYRSRQWCEDILTSLQITSSDEPPDLPAAGIADSRLDALRATLPEGFELWIRGDSGENGVWTSVITYATLQRIGRLLVHFTESVRDDWSVFGKGGGVRFLLAEGRFGAVYVSAGIDIDEHWPGYVGELGTVLGAREVDVRR